MKIYITLPNEIKENKRTNLSIYSRLIPYNPHSIYTRRGVTMIIRLPESTTYDSDLIHYANILKIPNFRHVKMRDELNGKPHPQECCIVNLNKHTQLGSHWTCYFKDDDQRYYFDSYGQAPPTELLKYLKTPLKFNRMLQSFIVVQLWFNILIQMNAGHYVSTC